MLPVTKQTLAWALSCGLAVSGLGIEPPPLTVSRAFHQAGVPELRRDARVDITCAGDGVVLQSKKTRYLVPYSRIHRIRALTADRVYEKTTYAAAVATYGAGAFLILKKHPVDTVILDYGNERGGLMGIVVQVEKGEGLRLIKYLAGKGVTGKAPTSPATQGANPE